MNARIPTIPTIPIELTAPPPRAIKQKTIPWSFIALGLFMLPHLTVGIVSATLLVGEPILILTTPARPAVVRDLNTSHGSKGGVTYSMRFEYSANGITYGEKEEINQSEFGALRVGGRITVHSVDFGLFHYAVLARTLGDYAGHRAFFWVWATFWNGFLGFFLSRVWRPILRARQLVRMGRPVVGKVIRKEITRGKSSARIVEYVYQAAGAPTVQQRAEMTVSRAGFKAVEEGMPVTILYDDNKPRRSIVYECANYTAVLA